MNADILKAADIPVSNDAMALLQAEAALDWMLANTTLAFSKDDAESIKALPACAKLFVVKYSEALSLREGVASQSIEGLSMSFNTAADKGTVLWQLARSLLGDYLKSQVRVYPAKRRW